MGCFHCFCCCKQSKDSSSQLRREGTKRSHCCRSYEEGNGRKNGCCEIGCLCCGESSLSKDVLPKQSSCFPCRKISKNDIESRGEGKEKKCFACFKSFNDEGKRRKKRDCESGCLCCKSSSKDDLPESRRSCCFPCKKSSKEAESNGEEKDKKCPSYFRSCKERKKKKRKCGVGYLCFKESPSNEESVEKKSRFNKKKSLKMDTESRKEENYKHYFSCVRSSKEEGNERIKRVCSIGSFCCGELLSKDRSSKSIRSCLPPKNYSKEESKSGEDKDKSCLSCFRSSKEDSSNTMKNGTSCCSCCCFDCCVGKSPKENSSKKVGGSCFHCCSGISSKKSNDEKTISQRIKTNEISTKRKENKVMCFCSFCCTKSLDKRKQMSETKCSFSCFYCIKSESRQNSSFKKRKRALSCWKIKEQARVENHLTTTMHILSLKSDYEDKVVSQANEILSLANKNYSMQVFTYKELVIATKNFSEDCLLGSGWCGSVYKGELQEKNEIVAVKQLKRNENQRGNEFFVDVVKFSLLHHPNLIKLLGYCTEEDQMILVYEYIPFGSLQDHLLDITTNNKPLDWFTRMKIAAGAAKGLEHLHYVADPPIIYRDMKASNILLDKNYNPKLSDFGLKSQTRVMGAYGCYAPEYACTRQFTKTTDVYSFGVLLLELITGRKAVDITKPNNEQYVAHWAALLFKDKRKYATMVDPLLNRNYPIKGLYQALAIANMCLQYEASSRPLMSDVVTAIEYLMKPETDCSEPLEQSSISDQLISSNQEKLKFQSISSEIESCGALTEEDEEAEA